MDTLRGCVWPARVAPRQTWKGSHASGHLLAGLWLMPIVERVAGHCVSQGGGGRVGWLPVGGEGLVEIRAVVG
jgi:hypothetical protein